MESDGRTRHDEGACCLILMLAFLSWRFRFLFAFVFFLFSLLPILPFIFLGFLIAADDDGAALLLLLRIIVDANTKGFIFAPQCLFSIFLLVFFLLLTTTHFFLFEGWSGC